jgi:hypothetical protein
MPSYRLVFPVPEGVPAEDAESAHFDSGDRIYRVGDVIEFRGRRWTVTEIPVEDPTLGQTVDVMVWPAD